MTTLADERPVSTAPADHWGTGARRCWLALLAAWLVMAGLALAIGERHSSVAELEQALRSGQLGQVRVTGGMEPHARGYSVVEVHWRDGLVAHWAELMQARPRRAAPQGGFSTSSDVITEDPATWIAERDPDVRVLPQAREGSDVELGGWRLHGWTEIPALGLMLCTLLALTSLPTPRRATRWAWFWLIAVAGPIGLPAYLLLGGPTPVVAAPRPGTWRLTGGLGFLLALALAAVLRAT